VASTVPVHGIVWPQIKYVAPLLILTSNSEQARRYSSALRTRVALHLLVSGQWSHACKPWISNDKYINFRSRYDQLGYRMLFMPAVPLNLSSF
jgi:hypothetical protein